MDLFDHARQEQIEREAPLAARMRPRTLDEFQGQEHVVGPGRLLRRAIQADQLSSVIFYGPPGTGKTTLAAVIANTTRSHFETLNAVLAGDGPDATGTFLAALRLVAKAQELTMVDLARDAELGRQALYRSLSQEGNPELRGQRRECRCA